MVFNVHVTHLTSPIQLLGRTETWAEDSHLAGTANQKRLPDRHESGDAVLGKDMPNRRPGKKLRMPCFLCTLWMLALCCNSTSKAGEAAASGSSLFKFSSPTEWRWESFVLKSQENGLLKWAGWCHIALSCSFRSMYICCYTVWEAAVRRLKSLLRVKKSSKKTPLSRCFVMLPWVWQVRWVSNSQFKVAPKRRTEG